MFAALRGLFQNLSKSSYEPVFYYPETKIGSAIFTLVIFGCHPRHSALVFKEVSGPQQLHPLIKFELKSIFFFKFNSILNT
jgi:hypothetical protein